MTPSTDPPRFLGISGADDAEPRFRLLLAIADSMASPCELRMLLDRFADLLPGLLPYDFVLAFLVDADRSVARVLTVAGPHDTRLRSDGLELPIAGTRTGLVFTTQAPLVVDDAGTDQPLQPPTDVPGEHDVRSLLLVPLTTPVRRIGVLGFYSRRAGAYAAADLDFVGRVAGQIALATDHTLNFENAQRQHHDMVAQRDRWRALLDVNNTLVTTLELPQIIDRVGAVLRTLMDFDHFVLALHDESVNQLRVAARVAEPRSEYTAVFERFSHVPLQGSVAGRVFTTRRPMLVTAPEPERFTSAFSQAIYRAGVKSACVVPLLSAHRTLGVLLVSSYEEARFSPRDLELLVQIGGQVAIAAENALAFDEISTLKDRLANEKIYLEEEIRGDHDFGEVVGGSRSLQRVLRQIETVAPTGSTVLLLGETGTGKELLARAIHDRSPRRGRTLVKVNCAAIPSGLLESELFGHEKGAFTGAIERKIGRFELAHQGTLFLDEVGDIPLELQAKLLRVLQDQEFERLGSPRSITVDVRIVAATNRGLHEMVAERQFRSDLFYRLNVFPITVPPLRERAEDIPRLARYFSQKFAGRMRKPVETIATETMSLLCRWPWPGNVRELANVIERAVIQSTGPVLRIPASEFPQTPPAAAASMTLNVAEREHIVKTLRETDWVIGGPHGAAARLGMKRTTLNSRMQKLGISRRA